MKHQNWNRHHMSKLKFNLFVCFFFKQMHCSQIVFFIYFLIFFQQDFFMFFDWIVILVFKQDFFMFFGWMVILVAFKFLSRIFYVFFRLDCYFGSIQIFKQDFFYVFRLDCYFGSIQKKRDCPAQSNGKLTNQSEKTGSKYERNGEQ